MTTPDTTPKHSLYPIYDEDTRRKLEQWHRQHQANEEAWRRGEFAGRRKQADGEGVTR